MFNRRADDLLKALAIAIKNNYNFSFHDYDYGIGNEVANISIDYVYLYQVHDLYTALSKKQLIISITGIEISPIKGAVRDLKFNTVPIELSLFHNLTELEISHRHMVTFADNLFSSLTKLKKLVLDSNNISSLPNSISVLLNLSTLSLQRNRLGSLPNFMSNLSNLSSLYLSSNLFNNVPECLQNLTKLSVLDLSNNNIRSISEYHITPAQLDGFNFNNNMIEYLPTYIVKGAIYEYIMCFCLTNPIVIFPENPNFLTWLQSILYYYPAPFSIAPLSIVNASGHLRFTKGSAEQATLELKQAKRMYVLLLLLCRVSQEAFADSYKCFSYPNICQIIYSVLTVEQQEYESISGRKFESISERYVTNYCTFFFISNGSDKPKAKIKTFKHKREYTEDQLIDDCYEAKIKSLSC